jgi:Bacterial membrane flanked domain.
LSGLFGILFLSSGAYAYFGQHNAPQEIGLPFIAFGLFTISVGLYVEYVAAPDKPEMDDNEEIIDTRSPVQRAAIAKMGIGSVLLGVFVYLVMFTFTPYIYPIAALIPGLYLFSTGLFAYWTNTLTTYYITNQRLIKEYRFISLVRQEVRLNKVRGVEERKSIWEALVGLGNVQASSGGGRALQVKAKNISKSTTFADEIRELL